jgi:CII-binding regulator of phage lambda lysogenization HflD
MRAEAQLREMRKARESLMSESRRMFSESSREWTSLLSNFYREQSGTVQTTVEKNLKDFQQIRDKKLTESRNQVQRQAQGIDLIQKKLSGVDRVKDQILQNIANLRKDAAQGIAQKIKQINT